MSCYAIVATGARNPLREVGTEWSAKDTMSALGYYVPASRDQIDIQFLPQLEGYIWVFPRCGHLSVGIGGKGEPAQAMRVRRPGPERPLDAEFVHAFVRSQAWLTPVLSQPTDDYLLDVLERI